MPHNRVLYQKTSNPVNLVLYRAHVKIELKDIGILEEMEHTDEKPDYK